MTAPYIDLIYAEGVSCEECGARMEIGVGTLCQDCAGSQSICSCGNKRNGWGGLCLECHVQIDAARDAQEKQK